MKERIGVYICHCGGNISDYVDVEELQRLMKEEDGVVLAKHVMFACADSNQKQMIQDIQEQKLDGIVVASCSPKLHLHTFRGVSERAGLNPYNYVQVNIREQCSWPHSDNPMEATHKAVGLIRGGIKKVARSEALESLEIEAKNSVLVIGAGVAGMKAAIELARVGTLVYLVEKEEQPGGRMAENGTLFMTGQNGKQLAEKLLNEVKSFSNITLFTNTKVERVSGSVGNFSIDVRVSRGGATPETMHLAVGSVLVATGYDHYQPKENEFGFGQSDRVITLPELKKIMEKAQDRLVVNGKEIRSLGFVYCVGSRQSKGENKYCSRSCCSSAVHTSLLLKEKFSDLRMVHLYRDIRTYGKQEILYEKSSKQGDIYLKYEEKEPPVVEVKGNSISVKVKDYLTSKKEIEFEPDLLVLVTGMVARDDSKEVASKFKIPVGTDCFFNEIHPKLKPVETVINGVFIGGSCQGPKNITESVQSSLSAVAKINSLIKNEHIQLEPIIARVNADACLWCGKCAEVCEYDALKEVTKNGKQIAEVNPATCKGCGICTPVCPTDALEVVQYTNAEIEGMIDGFMDEVVLQEKSPEDVAEIVEDISEPVRMKEYPQLWKRIAATLGAEHKTIPEVAAELGENKERVTWHMMTMNKYNVIMPDGMDKKETYYYYKLK